MTLEQIKNDYAVSKGADNWEDFTFWLESYEVETHMDKICILAQKECLKLSSDNILFNKSTQEPKENFIVAKDVCLDDIIYITANKDSIINENNIIK